ncbi:hypothetical protein HZH68_003546 [Vespula germanica]|uniref:Uncharacterized protein n=1 Tax=Vespula germanica TaxID=30212 RepID=A0A834NPH0_VESGE|nr:hypothetical protein HZH68_003546 [Vespula germanica]
MDNNNNNNNNNNDDDDDEDDDDLKERSPCHRPRLDPSRPSCKLPLSYQELSTWNNSTDQYYQITNLIETSQCRISEDEASMSKVPVIGWTISDLSRPYPEEEEEEEEEEEKEEKEKRRKKEKRTEIKRTRKTCIQPRVCCPYATHPICVYIDPAQLRKRILRFPGDALTPRIP